MWTRNNCYIGSNKFPCEADEEITSVQPLELSLPEMTADTNAVFCVGTVHHQIGEHEPSAGRILILIGNNDETSATRSNSQVKLVTSKRTDGCVYALDVSDDMIIAGINSSVGAHSTSLPSSGVDRRQGGHLPSENLWPHHNHRRNFKMES